MRIAYFISPHGFGHAARACAVMQALHNLNLEFEFDLYTRAPRWFFDISLDFPYTYHDTLSDVGLIQPTPLHEDLPATIQALENFLPIPIDRLEKLKQALTASGCSLVCCDISPLGIAAARAAGIPSVLIENFTWDWIYSGFLASEPGFNRFIPAFSNLFRQADRHVQTEPICSLSPNVSLLTHPVSRKPRQASDEVRSKLGIPENTRLVLVTMGGFELEYTFLNRLFAQKGIAFVIPGGSDRVEIRQNLYLLPHHSNFYHPDLLHASDAVISKAGYSTIAEAYRAGIPYGFVSRTNFRESPVLSNFIQTRMAGFEIDGLTFQTGNWIERIPDLLKIPRIIRAEPDGADQIAQYLKNEFFTGKVSEKI